MPAEPVLPYNGTGENGAGCFYPVSRFRQSRRTAKIQPVKGLRCGDFFYVVPAAEKILPGP